MNGKTNVTTRVQNALKKIPQKLWVPIAIAALCLFGAFVIVATAPSVEYKEPERAIQTVRTISGKTTTLHHRVRTQGTVAPRTEADLVPEVSGRVVWLSPSFAPGGFFKQGDALLRIESRDFELAVERQRAALKRAESEFDFAASELARRESLSKAGVASPSQLADARRAESVAEAAVISVPHPKWQERPLAVVVLKPDRAAGADELRAFLESRFAKWQVPDHVVFVPELPHASTGKLKSELRTRFQYWNLKGTRDEPVAV